MDTELTEQTDILRQELRGLDGDLYLCHLFAPAACRAQIMILYRIYADIARIPSDVSEPMLGAIRLQWWRDLLDALERGETRGVPIAKAVLPFWGHPFGKAQILPLIDGRDEALTREQEATVNELEKEAATIGPALMKLTCAALKANASEEMLIVAGTGFELMRLVPQHKEDAEEGEEVAKRAFEKLSEASILFNALPRADRKALLPAFMPIGLAKRQAQAYPKHKSLLRYQLSLLKMALIGKI